MWLELAGGAAAWLAHLLWYFASPVRCRSMGLNARFTESRAVPHLRGPGLLLAGLSLAIWIRAHGSALGSCSALAALMAAASVNAIVAPLARRGLLVFGVLALAGLLAATLGWLSGT